MYQWEKSEMYWLLAHILKKDVHGKGTMIKENISCEYAYET
jgi:hypothetical protein